MHIFYTPDICDKSYTLDETESKHCVKVLRLKENDEIFLVDGKGNLFRSIITDASPKRCRVSVLETKENYGNRSFKIHVGIAPTKSMERFEVFAEKATEIGIDKIIPVKSANSERVIIKTERIRKVIISAVKQSVKAYVPILEELTSFKDLIRADFSGLKFIAHCYDRPKQQISEIYVPNSDVLILIGPEGDFSEREVEEAVKAGFTEVNLSDYRLRTETAGIVACNLIHAFNMKKNNEI